MPEDYKETQERQREKLDNFDQKMLEAGNKGDVKELRRIKQAKNDYKREHRIR